MEEVSGGKVESSRLYFTVVCQLSVITWALTWSIRVVAVIFKIEIQYLTSEMMPVLPIPKFIQTASDTWES